MELQLIRGTRWSPWWLIAWGSLLVKSGVCAGLSDEERSGALSGDMACRP